LNPFDHYTHQQLAATGFAILDSATAARLRPDLWGASPGLGASHDFARAKDRLASVQGVKRFVLRLAGRPDLTVLARGDRDLTQRIEWILGEPVLMLFPESAIAGTPAPRHTPPRARPATSDRYAGIVTTQPGRPCESCDHLMLGNACRKSAESGIAHPAARELRRCLAFAPKWDAYDARTGLQLWPELLQAHVEAVAVAQG
jgi:hypothetical protein